MGYVPAALGTVLEDVFGVRIPSDDLERTSTVEALADYLADRLRKTPHALSPEVVRAFLDIRRAVALVMKRSAGEIRTTTPWKFVLPNANPGCRVVWREIQQTAQVSLPRLVWTGRTWRWPWAIVDFIVGTIGVLLLAMPGGGTTSIFIGGLLCVAVPVIFGIRSRAGSEPPHQTLGESARYVATERWTPTSAGTSAWTSAEVLKLLRDLVEGEPGCV